MLKAVKINDVSKVFASKDNVIELRDLKKVNLLAGLNNSGKSYLLELIKSFLIEHIPSFVYDIHDEDVDEVNLFLFLHLYDTLVNEKQKADFLFLLRLMDNRIGDIKKSSSSVRSYSIYLSDGTELERFDLSSGLTVIINILFYIYYRNHSNVLTRHIFIDGIERLGIHHSKMKQFWEKIFDIIKDMNIQIFASTNSLECLTAIADAVKDENDFMFYELAIPPSKNKTIINPFTHEFTQYGIRNNRRIMGECL